MPTVTSTDQAELPLAQVDPFHISNCPVPINNRSINQGSYLVRYLGSFPTRTGDQGHLIVQTRLPHGRDSQLHYRTLGANGHASEVISAVYSDSNRYPMEPQHVYPRHATLGLVRKFETMLVNADAVAMPSSMIEFIRDNPPEDSDYGFSFRIWGITNPSDVEAELYTPSDLLVFDRSRVSTMPLTAPAQPTLRLTLTDVQYRDWNSYFDSWVNSADDGRDSRHLDNYREEARKFWFPRTKARRPEQREYQRRIQIRERFHNFVSSASRARTRLTRFGNVGDEGLWRLYTLLFLKANPTLVTEVRAWSAAFERMGRRATATFNIIERKITEISYDQMIARWGVLPLPTGYSWSVGLDGATSLQQETAFPVAA